MMPSKILFSYLAKEILLYFFVLFLFFFFIFFVNQILLLAEDVLSKHVPFRDVVLLIFYSLPSIVATSMPFAALVGTLMAVGRMVSDREFLAACALGFSVRFLIFPVLIVGLCISVFSFITNDIFLPVGTIRFNRLRREIIASSPAVELESNSIKKNQNAVIVSGNISGNVMDKILVIDSGSSGERRVISAPETRIVESKNSEILVSLEMDNAFVFTFKKDNPQDYDVINSEMMSYNLLLRNIFGSYAGSITPQEMSSRDLYRELKIKEAGIPPEQRDSDRSLNMWRMEFNKKFSIPIGAFFFVLLAFSLGLGAKTNGQAVGFISGLIIAVIYWVLLIVGQTLSLRVGFNGIITMWLPNAVILIAGLIALSFRIFK